MNVRAVFRRLAGAAALAVAFTAGVADCSAQASYQVFGANNLGMHCYDADSPSSRSCRSTTRSTRRSSRSARAPCSWGPRRRGFPTGRRPTRTAPSTPPAAARPISGSTCPSSSGSAARWMSASSGRECPARRTPRAFTRFNAGTTAFEAAGIPITQIDDNRLRNPYPCAGDRKVPRGCGAVRAAGRGPRLGRDGLRHLSPHGPARRRDPPSPGARTPTPAASTGRTSCSCTTRAREPACSRASRCSAPTVTTPRRSTSRGRDRRPAEGTAASCRAPCTAATPRSSRRTRRHRHLLQLPPRTEHPVPARRDERGRDRLRRLPRHDGRGRPRHAASRGCRSPSASPATPGTPWRATGADRPPHGLRGQPRHRDAAGGREQALRRAARPALPQQRRPRRRRLPLLPREPARRVAEPRAERQPRGGGPPGAPRGDRRVPGLPRRRASPSRWAARTACTPSARTGSTGTRISSAPPPRPASPATGARAKGPSSRARRPRESSRSRTRAPCGSSRARPSAADTATATRTSARRPALVDRPAAYR